MIEFDSEMIVRFQDMRSPISYFSKVYGFNGFLNFYKRGDNTEASVTYLREGKTMDDLRKAIRAKEIEMTERKAGVTVRISEECYICEMIDMLLSVKGAFIEIPVLVRDGDVILRIKYFNEFSAQLQRVIFKDADKRDYFSIDYLGPVRSNEEWLKENIKSIEMRKLVFYVIPKNSFTLEVARKIKGLEAEVATRYVDIAGYLELFYEVSGDSAEWEKKLAEVALEYIKIKKANSDKKIFFAKVPEQGILIDPYKTSDLDLPFSYEMELKGDRAKVSMVFEKNTLDSFFKSISRISEQEFEESELEIKSVEKYP
ncbi:MAG: hypothetical protein ACP5MU_02955 [Thermoplasmata archaeon]